MKPVYHGWIYVASSVGPRHYSNTHRTTRGGRAEVKRWDHGEEGLARAIHYFETTLCLGRVTLLQTPLGLRICTRKEVSNDD